MKIKCGFVAVVGKPNAGKSTLTNALTGEKVSIVSPKPQTTRNNILGIYNSPDTQIVFVDTPGINAKNTGLDDFMQKSIKGATADVCAVIICCDVTKELSKLELDLIENYKKARSIFKKYAPDAITMDALSHYEFHSQGLVDSPVCSTKHIQTFLDNGVENLWAYYCCAETDSYLSNRFMSMPGERIRVLGMQLYLNNIKGFLHWGYNFYNSVLSDEPVDPYLITDGGGGLQSGDTFSVYPGNEGAVDSIRLECFYDGLQDYKLLKCLERKIGREQTERLLLDSGFTKSFTTYPKGIPALNKIRRKAQKLLCRK